VEPDASGRFSVAEVNLKKIMEAKTREENIQIYPHDVISVPKAEFVYVIGDVSVRAASFLAKTSPCPCFKCFRSLRPQHNS